MNIFFHQANKNYKLNKNYNAVCCLSKDGRVYMVDYEILEGIPFYGHNDESVENRYTCSALGLFYVKGSGDIVPIAIQFHQVPSETNPIWTPNDSELDWIYAKMWLRNADTQYHQVSANDRIFGFLDLT